MTLLGGAFLAPKGKKLKNGNLNKRPERSASEARDVGGTVPPNSVCSSQTQQSITSKRTIVFFENIDVLFPDEQGFLTTLEGLMQNSKIPLIVTAQTDVLSERRSVGQRRIIVQQVNSNVEPGLSKLNLHAIYALEELGRKIKEEEKHVGLNGYVNGNFEEIKQEGKRRADNAPVVARVSIFLSQ